MSAEIYNVRSRRDRDRREVPASDPQAWGGQMQRMVDPYRAREARETVQTGFRGRDVETVRDEIRSKRTR